MLKICNNCKVSKTYSEFSKGRGVCKICRNNTESKAYHTIADTNRLADRKAKRIEFREQLRIRQPDITDDDFNDMFIKEEDLKAMLTQPNLYSLQCEVPEFLEIMDRNSNTDYKDGYLLKTVYFNYKLHNRVRIVYII